MAVSEAHQRAEDRAEARPHTHRRPTLVAVFLALLMLASIGAVSPVAADGGGSQADRVIAAVSRHLGKPYSWGSTGPRAFDCSGLVYRAFKEAHLSKRIGGFNTAHGYYFEYRRKNKTSRTDGKPGDLVVYDRGGHVGIYLGNGKVISALVSGVKRHPLKGLNIRFTTFIHLGLANDSSSLASKSKPATYRKAARSLPLRAKPGRGARLVRSVSKGKKLQVLQTRDRGNRGVWVRVKLPNGDRGWARKALTKSV